MSNKIVNSDPNLSTEVVDKKTGEVRQIPRYIPPRLNRAGMEVPSAISLVAVPAIRDFDLGHRIMRYQKAPDSVQARYDENAYDSDDVDFDNPIDTDSVNPMSPHELRFGEVQQSFVDKQKERIKAQDDEKAAKLKQKKEEFRALYKDLQEAGAIPPAETPKNEA